jgi:hypothetical protein
MSFVYIQNFMGLSNGLNTINGAVVVPANATHGYCHCDSSASTTIDRFAFATDGNALDVGDTNTGQYERGASSDITGGYSYVFSGKSGSTRINSIERHQNASSANGADVGDLTTDVRAPSSSESSTHGYRAGGWNGSGVNVIDKFAFGSSSAGTDVGDLTVGRTKCGGCTSSTHGYTIGGFPASNVIDKYQYSSDANATDVGDALSSAYLGIGTEDDDAFGYLQGNNSDTTQVQRFSFSVDGDAVDVGNLNRTGIYGFGATSLTYGYNSQGAAGASDIQKHTFASSVVMTDVGELSVSRLQGSTGSQG